jgi:hypothetical protein
LSELYDSEGKALPVVVFSAQDANPLVAARVDAMLTKSLTSIDKLVAILRRIVAEKASSPRRASSPAAFQQPNQEVA